MAVIQYYEYDESSAPSTLYVSYPNVVEIYEIGDAETNIADVLFANGKLRSTGVPVISSFSAVNSFSSSAATVSTEPGTELILESSFDSESWSQNTVTANEDGVASAPVDGLPRYYRTRVENAYVDWTTTTSQPASPHLWLTYQTVAQAVHIWSIVKVYVPMSAYFTSGETTLFLARITQSANDLPLLPSDVESIRYTAYRINGIGNNQKREEIKGHVNVEVPASSILTELETNDPRWNSRSNAAGYNFIFEPNTRVNPLFDAPGRYVVIFTITPVLGNPAPISYSITVNG